MKVSPSVKPRCSTCKIVLRPARSKNGIRKGGRNVQIICATNPNHRQRQG